MSTAELSRPLGSGFGRRATDRREPPRRERRQRETGPDVRGEANGVDSLFPALRSCDDLSEASACRGVSAFDPRASVTSWIVEEGLELLDPAERQRVVDRWRIPRQGSSASLIADGGCDVLIGGAVVTGAVRMALIEWLPLSRDDLAVYEGGLFRDVPANALTLLVRPPTIWSIDEAVIADSLHPRGPRFEPSRFAALERYARGRLGTEHLARLRDAAAKIELQLPIEGLPFASTTLAAGCAVIADDDDWSEAIAARQLARYATSARVARGRGSASVADRATHANVCAC
jgi:hypothetical protein